jgi:hypothetical protein
VSAGLTLEERLAVAQSEGLGPNLRRWLAFAGYADGTPYELQALKVRPRAGSDYRPNKFAHVDSLDAGIKLLESGERFDCPGLYTIANPLRPGVATREQLNSWHQMAKGESTTDDDIAARRFLIVDIDAERAKNTSASDEEMACTIPLALRIYEHLAAIVEGDDALAYAHTGNGRMIIVRLNDLAEHDAAPLIRGVVQSIARAFLSAGAHVDITITDAKRLLPAWGSTKRKGLSGIAERPHRRTAIITPELVVPLGLAQLETLHETLRTDADGNPATASRRERKPSAGKSASPSAFSAGGAPRFNRANAVDVEEVIERLNLRDGEALQCPGCGSTDGVSVFANGLKCFHNRCAERGTPKRRGFRTVVDLVAEVLRVEPLDAVGRVEEWFGLGTPHSVTERQRPRPDPSPPQTTSNAPPPSDVRSTCTPWPKPIAEAAFHGLAGEFVRLIDAETESDPVAVLAQVLVFFGNVIGRRAHFVVESEKHFAKLFIVLVGPSAKGRKGTSLSRVLYLFRLADQDWAKARVTKAGLSSGEGLIHHVRDPVENDKDGGDGDGGDPGISDKRLLVVQTEFATVCEVMKRQGNTLSSTVRQAWDDSDLGTLTKTSAEKATGTHISIIGHITRDEVRQKLDKTEAANGFANRFLYFATTRSKELPFGGRDVDLTDIADRLADAIRFGQATGRVEFDESAAALWAQVYAHLSRDRWGMAGSITERAEAQTRRVAMIYALLDRCDRIQEVHLKAALAFWAYAEESAYSIWGDKSGNDAADEILLLLRDAPGGLTRTEIRNHFQRHGAGVPTAIKMLLERGVVRIEKDPSTGGRAGERIFAVAANRGDDWWRPENMKGDANERREA